jgi:hypothetical protein
MLRVHCVIPETTNPVCWFPEPDGTPVPNLVGAGCPAGMVGRPRREHDVSQRYGSHSVGETPGPIPNPEAKPHSADGTAPARVWESRTLPNTTPTRRGPHHGGPFFCILASKPRTALNPEPHRTRRRPRQCSRPVTDRPTSAPNLARCGLDGVFLGAARGRQKPAVNRAGNCVLSVVSVCGRRGSVASAGGPSELGGVPGIGHESERSPSR